MGKKIKSTTQLKKKDYLSSLKFYIIQVIYFFSIHMSILKWC